MRFWQRRKGFTFVEILIVMTLITALSTMGVAVFSGVLDYFRARRSMENLMWDLRKSQQRARSRGHAVGSAGPGSSPGVFGVQFYAGRLTATGAVEPDGCSYYVYGPVETWNQPSLAGLRAMSGFQRERLFELDGSLIPVDNGATSRTFRVPPAAAAAANKRVQFTIDVANENNDQIPDLFSAVSGANNFMDFRLQNDEGYFRISFERDRYIGLRYIDL